MARTILTYQSSELTLTQAVRKCVVGVTGGYGARQTLREISLSLQGGVPAALPCLVRLCGAVGTLTGGTSLTAQKRGTQEIVNATDITPISTAKENFTIPGTIVNILKSEEIHPNGGSFLYQWWERMDAPDLLHASYFTYWLDVLMPGAEGVVKALGRIEIEE